VEFRNGGWPTHEPKPYRLSIATWPRSTWRSLASTFVIVVAIGFYFARRETHFHRLFPGQPRRRLVLHWRVPVCVQHFDGHSSVCRGTRRTQSGLAVGKLLMVGGPDIADPGLEFLCPFYLRTNVFTMPDISGAALHRQCACTCSRSRSSLTSSPDLGELYAASVCWSGSGWSLWKTAVVSSSPPESTRVAGGLAASSTHDTVQTLILMSGAVALS